jgi:hypothetical protein
LVVPDPQDRTPNNLGITVDCRAFGLATGGLEGAEQHFRDGLDAFGIKYVEPQVRVTRADFAIDLLEQGLSTPNRYNLLPTPLAVSEQARPRSPLVCAG